MLDLKKLFDKILTSITNLQNSLNNFYIKTEIDTFLSTKLNKTGDTITGSLNEQLSSINASNGDNNVSSIQYPTTFNILDNAGRIMTRQEAVVNPNGNIGSYWYIRNYDINGTLVAQKGLQMHMAKDGTLTYNISDPDKFINALSPGKVYARARYQGSGDVQFTSWVPFNTVEANIGGGTWSNGQYIVPSAGVYIANFTCYSNQPTEGRACVTATNQTMTMCNQNNTTSITAIYNLNAGDHIMAGAYSTTFPIRLYAASGHNSFTIVKLY